MYNEYMATITVTLTTEAHRRLKKLKEGNESFSDVILREIPERIDTFGDLLKLRDVPPMDPKIREIIRKGRGRASNRPKRHAH